MIPNCGVMFGMYYQMDPLNTSQIYETILPAAQGYPSMNESMKKNPLELREGDGQYYVKIRKEDGLQLRCEKV